MARKPRKPYEPRTQKAKARLFKSFRNGRSWGRYDSRRNLLPGMESFPRGPDWSMSAPEIAHWAAWDRGYMQGYLDAAEEDGLTTPVAQPESEA